MLGIPCDGVGVEILGGIEPQVELLLPVALPLSKHIGVDDIWLAANVTEELEVDLIMCGTLRA